MSHGHEPADSITHQLSRVLGLVFGLAVVVGGIIGSGIMRAPGVVAKGITSEPLTLLLWAVIGAVALFSSMPLVEAGASVPRAGGSYPIATRAFGPTLGFMTGWLTWLQYTASNAFIAVVFAEYVHRLGFLVDFPTHDTANAALAVGLIAVMAALNMTATRVSGGSQTLSSAVKGGAFILVAIILFASPRAGAAYHPVVAQTVAAGAAGVSGVIMAVRVIYQTYAGWDGAIYFSEEVHNPEQNVARATFLGIGLVTVVYLLVNAAMFHVLAPSQIAGSELAVGDAIKVSLGSLGNTVITSIGVLSLGAIVNLQIMASSRITYRMGVDGILPRFIAVVSPGGAPRRSVAAVAIVSALFAGSGSYEAIIRVYAPWSIGSILMICLASVWLRYREPDLARPFKTPFFPILSIAATLIQAALIALVVIDDPASGMWSALIVSLPLPLYWWFHLRSPRAA